MSSITVDGRVYETGLTLEEIGAALPVEEAARLARVTAKTVRNYVDRGMPIVAQPGKWNRIRVRRQVLEGVLTGRIVLRPADPRHSGTKAA